MVLVCSPGNEGNDLSKRSIRRSLVAFRVVAMPSDVSRLFAVSLMITLKTEWEHDGWLRDCEGRNGFWTG